jgi:hypothetical protein
LGCVAAYPCRGLCTWLLALAVASCVLQGSWPGAGRCPCSGMADPKSTVRRPKVKRALLFPWTSQSTRPYVWVE